MKGQQELQSKNLDRTRAMSYGTKEFQREDFSKGMIKVVQIETGKSKNSE